MKTRVLETPEMTYRISKYTGKCKHCGELFYAGDKVNWNPRVKGTACHAGCYAQYGSPISYYEQEQKEQYVPKTVHVTPEVLETPNKVETPKQENGTLGEQLVNAVAPYLDQRLKALVDRTQVEAIINQVLETKVLKVANTIEISREDEQGFWEQKDMGVQHKQFVKLLSKLKARQSNGYRLNIWLTGPAGTGKTTAAKNCAEALGLDFYFTGSIDTEYKLTGFVDAQGKIVNTAFRKAYENGGVFLFDECDSSLPAALLAFNAALANGECAFPDGIVARHKDFVCIAAANTWGLGATNEYVGRLKLDAAFLDRFVFLNWEVDEALETLTCGNEDWAKKVQQYRAKAKAKGIKVIISPRASYFGAALLAAGESEQEVLACTVRKAMTDEQWNSICY